MARTIRILAALSAAVVLAVALGACGGGVPSDAVATINGTPITKSTFDHWLGVAAASSTPAAAAGQTATKQVAPDPPSYSACIAQKKATAPKPANGQPPVSDSAYLAQCQQQYTGLRDQVMQFLISANWIQGEAADQDVKVSDQQVQQQFQTLKQRQFPKEADFQKFLAGSGMSLSDLLFRVRLNLLSQKIQQKVTHGTTNVTNAQVSNYYNQNKARFAQPQRRNLQLVLTKTQGAGVAALHQIQSGQPFAKVAKSASTDPATKSQGGLLVAAVETQLEQPFGKAAFAAKQGVLSGPIKTPFGYYVFRVNKIIPASQQTLAQATPQIKQLLVSTNQQQSLSKFVMNFQKKWKARTTCRANFTTLNCKNYTAPKTPQLPGAQTVPQPSAPPSGTTTTR